MKKKISATALIISSIILGSGILAIYIAKKHRNNLSRTTLPKKAYHKSKWLIGEFLAVAGQWYQEEEDQNSDNEETETGNENESNLCKFDYPIHTGITSTVFWIGEGKSDDNDEISNSRSVWDDKWKEHFGGRDNPTKRNGYYPADFIPKENPFYVALPYNDLQENGKHKEDLAQFVPWFKCSTVKPGQSVLKNRWIKITKDGKSAFAQWEDAGPFGEDDADYVFGKDTNPDNKANKRAGIDVSPAVRDYLNLKDIDNVDWQFVDFEQVPSGPWKKIITRSQVSWN